MDIKMMAKMLARLLNTTYKSQLEYITLLLFITLFLICYYLKFFSYIFLVTSALIGAFVFIIFNKYSSNEQEQKLFFELPENKLYRIRLILSTVFILFYALSFLTLLQGFYTKTIWYYVFISLCAGVIATEIFFVETKNQGIANLIKSFLLVLNITLSNQILFPSGIALPDFQYHLYRLVIPIINNGYIPQIQGYEYFPCHQIFIVVNSLVAGSDPKMTYLFIGGFVISLGLLFVFIIGNSFVNLKFGLFVALIYTSLDYLIMYGSHPVHMSSLYFLSIMLFMVALYIYEKRDARFIALYLLIVISMVFMHHFSAMIVLIVLTSMIVIEILQRAKDRHYSFRLPGLIRLYAVILFAQWMYYSNMMGGFIGIIKAYNNAFTEGSSSIITATTYDKLPIMTLFLNTLGSDILILLSTIGFLYFFFMKDSFYKNVIIISTLTFVILLGIGVFIKLQWLLPDRMYPFLQLFGLVFLGSAGIIWILNIKIKQYKLKKIVVIVLIMNLTFFSLSSTIAGFETSLFIGKKTTYFKLYETPYESYFNQWTAFHMQNNSTVLETPPITMSGDIDIQKIKDNSFIIFNKFYLKTGFVIIRGVHMGQYDSIKLKDDESHVLERYSKYYDNGMVLSYWVD